ncbi:glycine rich domain-containing protein [Clostridioides sp. ES-S-0048-02]|uniref:glycine rich domain-containing protein n=1 Tax=Clostridioides sp. ES-S-0048-02 TaxID=2770777 RepID=UPI001D10308C|nr:hypothetical protein [Clostridioides sp. ES-S-0048-02]
MATVYEFNYTGKGQIVTLPPGKYKLECWGAAGGCASGVPKDSGSRGGYTSGELTLKKETTLYVYVGQDGSDPSNTGISGSFNGGGGGNVAKGGGATDIRLNGYTTTQWDASWSIPSRIIVAGGGGGVVQGYVNGNAHGGGEKGDNGFADTAYAYAPGGTQFNGGRGYSGSQDGEFGYSTSVLPKNDVGGGGGWYGGASCASSTANRLECNGGGGSGYVLTKDSYKPIGINFSDRLPTSEYYMTNPILMTGGNTTSKNGYAKITLLQSLPFLNISSYNSTTATFKADHTDPTLLTKIEVFIDDVLKETLTTDLTSEKTINYTLEDNALHTVKIVVTDSANATAEKVVSISKNIMPLGDDASLQDIASKVKEMKHGLINGKTSIINVLALKNIESSLNNTLVELSEKIKASFDSGDVSLEDLTNKLTQANNTISQLNSKYKVASGTTTALLAEGRASLFEVDYHGGQSCAYNRWIKVTGLNFTPNIFVAFENHKTSYPYFRFNFTFACKGVFDKDFGVVSFFSFRGQPGETSYDATGNVIHIDKGTPYMNENGIYLPIYTQDDYTTCNWYAIKFK